MPRSPLASIFSSSLENGSSGDSSSLLASHFRPSRQQQYVDDVYDCDDDDDTNSLEMTEEQHLLLQTSTSTDSGNFDHQQQQQRRQHSQSRRFSLPSLRRRSRRSNNNNNNGNLPAQQSDDPSVASTPGDLRRVIDGLNRQHHAAAAAQPQHQRDAVTVVSGGLRSVTTLQTFSSHETLKASNKQQQKQGVTTTASPFKDKDAVVPAPPNEGDPSKSSSSTAITPKANRWRHLKKAASRVVRKQLSREPDDTATSAPPPPLNVRSRSNGTDATADTSWTPYPNNNNNTNGNHHHCWEPQDEFKRQDGVDVPSLGSAFARIHPLPWNAATAITGDDDDAKPWNDWMRSCATTTTRYPAFDAATAVRDMISSSRRHNNTATTTSTTTRGGGSARILVLEGFGETDRWSIRVERELTERETSSAAASSLPLKRDEAGAQSRRRENEPSKDGYHPGDPTPNSSSLDEDNNNNTDDDGGSPDLPTQTLWKTLWGSEPAPASTLPTLEEIGTATSHDDDEDDDDPLLDLAAESSVPIDVDEDTFIVSTPEHLDAIHGIASVPLAAGRFGAALRILQKIVLGLDANAEPSSSSLSAANDVVAGGVGDLQSNASGSYNEARMQQHLRGVTYHNMGILHLWQEDYRTALGCFEKAVQARQVGSPRTLAVSQVRQGQALLALKRYSQALASFEQALQSTEEDQVVRAKVWTNVGVAHYLTGDLSQALAAFTSALTIQRKWLEQPIRRESLVMDAATTLQNMGKLYLERGDAVQASAVYEEAWRLLKTVLRKHHPVMLASLEDLAVSLVRQNNDSGVAKAIKLLERVRRCRVEVDGTSAATTMQTCAWMAHLCARDCSRHAQAQTLYQAVYAWQKGWLPSHHPARLHIRQCLAQLPKQHQVQQKRQDPSSQDNGPWI